MFETIDQARDEIRKLSDAQLAQLMDLLFVEWLTGRVTDEQADFVAALILDSTMERLAAVLEKEAGATVN
jgi:hypothetical protein